MPSDLFSQGSHKHSKTPTKHPKRCGRGFDEPIAPVSRSVTDRCPLEVIETIIDFLYDDPHTLSACSRVCKAWLGACREHLFGEIILRQRNFNAFFSLFDSPEFESHVRSRAHTIKMVQDLRPHQRWFQYCIPHMGKFHITHLYIKGLRTDEWALGQLGHPEISPLVVSFPSIVKLELVGTMLKTLAQFVEMVCGLPNLEQLSLVNITFNLEINTPKALTHQENRFPRKLQVLRLWYYLPSHGRIIYRWLEQYEPVPASLHTFSIHIACEYPGADVREEFWTTAGGILSKYSTLKHVTIAAFGLSATDVLSHNNSLLSLRLDNIDLRVAGPLYIRDHHVSWQWVPELLNQVTSPDIQVVELRLFFNCIEELEVLDWERIAQSFSRTPFSHIRSIHFMVSKSKKQAGKWIREKLPECTKRGIIRVSQPVPGFGYNERKIVLAA